MTLVLVMMAFFAVLALDIAVPATVLSAMALLRWTVRYWPSTGMYEERAA
ncbi:hypothetical protein NBH19_05975 [Rhizobium sp. S95]|uniref:Uncharacterized protein n=1 Tax=Ciceribacter sichuanensis TaxID=2949647 RepID=A0AAJ1BUH7_9HYPH|nr:MULTISPECIES: hypothetical protein [unclassified Ciceribacter]MCM2395635.1 hypothetical protein [Ciceribacter sp. S95]MCM2399975.1 hypothetical protein [Ciceribacter sp. S153]MCO5956057.1 hypothetical protein [Ciceribacter sp. S101]